MFAEAQEPQFNSIDNTLKQFYSMLSENNHEKRTTLMEQIFTKTGQISSVNHQPNKPASIISSHWSQFASGSKSLYERYFVTNNEVERVVDFYQDLASVNGIVQQVLTDKISNKKYLESYWMQIEMVYINNRWYIDYTSWTNQLKNSTIENAILSDTLLHRISW